MPALSDCLGCDNYDNYGTTLQESRHELGLGQLSAGNDLPNEALGFRIGLGSPPRIFFAKNYFFP